MAALSRGAQRFEYFQEGESLERYAQRTAAEPLRELLESESVSWAAVHSLLRGYGLWLEKGELGGYIVRAVGSDVRVKASRVFANTFAGKTVRAQTQKRLGEWVPPDVGGDGVAAAGHARAANGARPDRGEPVDVTELDIVRETHRRVSDEYYKVLLHALQEGAARLGYQFGRGPGGEGLPEEVVVALGHVVMRARLGFLEPARAVTGAPIAIVARLNRVTGAVLAATYLGASRSEEGRGIAADDAGITILGTTTSTDFPVTGAYRTPCGPDRGPFQTASFVAKLNMDLSALVGGATFAFLDVPFLPEARNGEFLLKVGEQFA
jgi:hypothetical protein